MAADALQRAACVLAAALTAVACGCGGDDADDDVAAQCLAPLPDCTPAFPPSYDAIFENVLDKTCASSSTGGSCHFGPTESKAQGGLVLSDRELAYDALLGVEGHARVVPGDAECSMLMQRLESTNDSIRMPLGGDPLDKKLRCAVRKWIEDGAKRK